MSTQNNVPVARHQAPRGWWRWLLTLSLVGNIAVAGMFAGVALSHKAPLGPVAGGPIAIGPLARALPAEERRALTDAMRDNPDFRPRPREVRDAERAALVDAIAAVPFDAEALMQVMENMRAEGAAAQERSEAALVAHISGMSDAGRAALAARVQADYEERRGPPPRD